MSSLRLHTERQPSDKPIRTAVVAAGLFPEWGEKLVGDRRLEIRRLQELGELFSLQGSDCEPELILVEQVWSDQYASQERDELFNRYPLARILCVYGPLCAADGRTRTIWNAALRVPPWKLPQRVEQEIEILRRSAAALPLTATREEVFQFESQAICKPVPSRSLTGSAAHRNLIAIYSPDLAWGISMAAFLSQFNPALAVETINDRGKLLALRQQVELAGIVFDMDPLTPSLQDWWTKSSFQREQIPVLWVSSFAGRLQQFQQETQIQPGIDRLNLPALLDFCVRCAEITK